VKAILVAAALLAASLPAFAERQYSAYAPPSGKTAAIESLKLPGPPSTSLALDRLPQSAIDEIRDGNAQVGPRTLQVGVVRDLNGMTPPQFLDAVRARMTVRDEMLNGFGVAHGGITFSLADSAFAFACNSRGRHTVSIHCTVEHVAAVFAGDVLIAEAKEEQLGKSISNYAIRVTRQDGTPVAFFRGVAYRKQQVWE